MGSAWLCFFLSLSFLDRLSCQPDKKVMKWLNHFPDSLRMIKVTKEKKEKMATQFLGYTVKCNSISLGNIKLATRGNLTYTWHEVPLEYASSIPRLAGKELKWSCSN